MNFTNKLFAWLLVAVIAFSTPAFASVGVYNDDEKVGTAADLIFSDGLQAEREGNKVRVSSGGTGDLTFQSTLLANGRAGGASTMSSSSTFLSTAGIAYSVINKRVGGGGGLDGDGKGSILPNGTNGQVLTLVVTAVQSGGEWVVTPNNGWNWNKGVFNAVDDMLTMLYVTSVGWIIQHNTSVVITRNQLP